MKPGRRDWLESGQPFAGMSNRERGELRQLAATFLREKHIDPVGGLRLDPGQRELLALQACLPILNLGLSYYDNWLTLIVYPRTFIPAESDIDLAGVVHPPEPRIGESWPNGPVLVSWKDVLRDMRGDWDYAMNVVIHELAHQLDVRNGAFDGMPELPRDMDTGSWIRDFTAAYGALRRAIDREEESWMDPYAAESPAEFFAVACETFFVAPDDLMEGYPKIYRQLQGYFRQDPLTRMGMERA
ncbi:MAG: zinc-dependent peptidase [Magnetococcales bacterium]|nr:zinc-dependent peptidase [Magnetococcales bacterium]